MEEKAEWTRQQCEGDQPVLVFGLQDELLNPLHQFSFMGMGWVIIMSSNLNSSANVLDTAYAFTDLVGERPESGYTFPDDTTFNARGRIGDTAYHQAGHGDSRSKTHSKGAAFGRQMEPERGVVNTMAANEGNNREEKGMLSLSLRA
ncbi:hypothetical protein DFH08DRAFT_801961 [Mycena albidolilacea]|uniref:Uncharacterized protein n=1 Tax=Mycena albidolilacea TaxID=1033008 RepID=A0AAD7AGL6_9AGAR|nr:hypothetical protein DFH08DRAFT_801961 [Mycena albidolilacea]